MRVAKEIVLTSIIIIISFVKYIWIDISVKKRTTFIQNLVDEHSLRTMTWKNKEAFVDGNFLLLSELFGNEGFVGMSLRNCFIILTYIDYFHRKLTAQFIKITLGIFDIFSDTHAECQIFPEYSLLSLMCITNIIYMNTRIY